MSSDQDRQRSADHGQQYCQKHDGRSIVPTSLEKAKQLGFDQPFLEACL